MRGGRGALLLQKTGQDERQIVRLHAHRGRRAAQHQTPGSIRLVRRRLGGDQNEKAIERDPSEPRDAVPHRAEFHRRAQLRSRRPGNVGRVRTDLRRLREIFQIEFDVELLVARRGHGYAERRRWRDEARGAGATVDALGRKKLDAIEIVVAAPGRARVPGARFGGGYLRDDAAVAGRSHDQ
jgi:hypothetical protein